MAIQKKSLIGNIIAAKKAIIASQRDLGGVVKPGTLKPGVIKPRVIKPGAIKP